MKGIYTGSFDPVTCGHVNVLERISQQVDELYVVMFTNPNKKYEFSEHERLNLIVESTKHIKNIIVDCCDDDLVINYCKSHDIDVIFRGLRTVTDFEYELLMATTNKQLSNIDTFFVPADIHYSNVSSSMVKELAKYGAKISYYVPDCVNQALINKYNTNR